MTHHRTAARLKPVRSEPERPSGLTPSARLTALPTYVFAHLDELKMAARARGQHLIDLGIGNPDQPTPPAIVAEIKKAYDDPRTHGYPPFRGTPRFLEAIAGYMGRRFGVEIDPDREAIALSGGKEGIAQLTLAYAEPGTATLVGDIHYPVHARATGLAGGDVEWLPLRAERRFIPDLDAVPPEVARRARLLVLNYPHNPTGAVATRDLFGHAVEFCREHGIVLVSDLAYAELTFDGYVAPSVLEIPEAREVAIEFHSLSKSFNMAGSRLGFAVGNADLVDTLHAVRTNMGYGTPAAIQAGGAYALDHAEELVPIARARYEARRDMVVEGFRALGWPAVRADGAMFVWLPTPGGEESQRFVERVLDATGVVFTPGHAFGPGGRGWFRVSLVAERAVFDDAFARLATAGIRFAR